MRLRTKITLHLSEVQADTLQRIVRILSKRIGESVRPEIMAGELFRDGLENSAKLWAKELKANEVETH